MNCVVRNEVSTLIQHLEEKPLGNKTDIKFAYVWYATNTEYFCSALAALEFLQTYRKSSSLQVDYVLMMDEDTLAALKKMIHQWVLKGGLIKKIPSLQFYINDKYYKKCYQKFQSFLLIEYQRIIYMDSDGFPLQNLDHLFFFPMVKGKGLKLPIKSFIESVKSKE